MSSLAIKQSQTLPLNISTSLVSVECVGTVFLHYLRESGIFDGHVINLNEDEIEEVSESTVFEDDIDYLRSLDPKDWKNQDHYAVLGLKNLRFHATDDDIKRAYRQKVLKHHPDKRKAQGEDVRTEDDYFTCITKAYEMLGVPNKRRSFDSIDPTFDDSLPTSEEIKKDFFKTFNQAFDLNSRWSEKKKVPKLGDETTSREDVEKFYSFWYDFESWREFSYLDEEEKEKGQDREERRWIEKQNKAARAKRKKSEMTRIRNLVDLAYNADPRIAKFKLEDKERKLAVKQAKRDAIQARKDEEERAAREALLLKEKAEDEERARNELKKQEREIQKKALKKERKALRDFCKSNNYFSENANDNVTNMTIVEKLCEMFNQMELENFNKELQEGGREAFLKAKEDLEKKLEEERRAMMQQSKTASVVENKDPVQSESPKWTTERVQLLIKAVNIFPAGTNQRWDVVASFINQHCDCTNIFTAKDVLAKAKDMQKTDFSRNNLKSDLNNQAFNNFEKNHKASRIDDVTITEKSDEPVTNGQAKSEAQHGDGKKEKAEATPWTPDEQKLLEQALKTFPVTTDERWDRIAECIPTRNKKECMRRYKELVNLIKAKKAAQAVVNPKAQ